jgi:two-component system, LytTR family, sensor kinase
VSNNGGLSDALFWKLQLRGWGVFALLVLCAKIPFSMDLDAILYDEFLTLSEFGVSFLLRYYCDSLLRQNRSWVSYEFRTFLISIPAGAVCVLPAAGLASLFGSFDWGRFLFIEVQTCLVLFLWCSLYCGIEQWQRLTQTQERLLRAESAAREARLNALRWQLNPHFLFNSLNAASMLIVEGDGPAARRMLGQIANLLRSTLQQEPTAEVPLAREIDLTCEYLEIERTRLGDRLRVEMDVHPETLDARTPSLILQPLVENAIRHGVAPCISGGTVRVASQIAEGRLRLTVANTGEPFDRSTSGSGIGLANTAERLTALYGEDHRFTMESPKTGGCIATLEIPLRRSGAAVEQVPCAS